MAAVLILSLLTCGLRAANAQSREAEDPERPIGGITFTPPRPAMLRHKAGNVIRGDLMAISPEQVQYRLQSGRVLLYELREVRSIVTSDRAFRYNSAYDTYNKAEQAARGLPGVTIQTPTPADRPGAAPEMPAPPAPPLPVVVDSPENYAPRRIEPSGPAVAGAAGRGAPGGANAVASIPPIPAARQSSANAGLANVPFHETGAFKVGFLVACIVVILLWWRNRVG